MLVRLVPVVKEVFLILKLYSTFNRKKDVLAKGPDNTFIRMESVFAIRATH